MEIYCTGQGTSFCATEQDLQGGFGEEDRVEGWRKEVGGTLKVGRGGERVEGGRGMEVGGGGQQEEIFFQVVFACGRILETGRNARVFGVLERASNDAMIASMRPRALLRIVRSRCRISLAAFVLLVVLACVCMRGHGRNAEVAYLR